MSTLPFSAQGRSGHQGPRDPLVVRILLIGTTLAFFGLFLVLPVVTVFAQAFDKGVAAYLAALREPDALSAVRLTLLTAAIAVPCNIAFGMIAGWAFGKFQFPGKHYLVTLIDLPFAVSPVIAGWCSCCSSAGSACSAPGSPITT